ncbi:TonB system transport protein ExbD [Tepidicaulis sp. LMO-SS28]|uniref:TonB system transport protein ExbD n=1 Tax=Tepidicaulis sp. LMO-SS28 TaxID=3447455 RepID=UPI003EDFF8B6
MAAKLGSDTDEIIETHEINVTPFIDVILVLLIVFMIAAPLATVDVPVDLPSAAAEPQPKPQEPVFLSVQEDLTLSLGDNTVERDALGAALDELTDGNKDERIFLRADKSVDYGDLMDVMNTLRRDGYLKIALVGLEETAGAPPAP